MTRRPSSHQSMQMHEDDPSPLQQVVLCSRVDWVPPRVKPGTLHVEGECSHAAPKLLILTEMTKTQTSGSCASSEW